MQATLASLLVATACAALAWGEPSLRATQRRLSSEEEEAGPRFLFEPVDGGYQRACRGASATDNQAQYFNAITSKGMSEEECKAHCRAEPSCRGIEFHPSVGRCEVWVRPDGIGASVSNAGSTCLRYEPLARFAPVGEGACRGAHANDNKASYFEVFQGITTQGACERLCLASGSCRGIEYHAGASRCEVWTRPEGIEATKALDGYVCLRLVPALQGCGAFDSLLQDTDLAGKPLKEVLVESAEQCCSACGATAGCEGFSYLGQACYLKTAINGTYSNPGCVARVKMLSGNCSGLSAPQADTDLAGDMISAKFSLSVDHCCSACTDTRGCEGFSYFGQTCYLKSGLTGTYSKPGCVTQVKSLMGNCEGFMESQDDTDLAGDLISSKFAQSGDSCCSACTEAEGCQGYSYVGQTCYLKGNLTGTYRNPGCTARFRSLSGNCTEFSELQQDTDIVGDLLATEFATSVDVCCDLCKAADGCEGYVYFGRMCFLKSHVTGTYSNAGRMARILSTQAPVMDELAPPSTVAPGSCGAYTAGLVNTDLAGELIKEVHTASEEQCCGACGAEPTCEGFAYLEEFHSCYLKRQLLGIFTKFGAVARVQRPSGSCDGFNSAPPDSDLSGDLVATVFALSAGDCCAACMARAACQGFTHFSQVCYLKANLTSVWNNPGRVSLCLGECSLR